MLPVCATIRAATAQTIVAQETETQHPIQAPRSGEAASSNSRGHYRARYRPTVESLNPGISFPARGAERTERRHVAGLHLPNGLSRQLAGPPAWQSQSPNSFWWPSFFLDSGAFLNVTSRAAASLGRSMPLPSINSFTVRNCRRAYCCLLVLCS